MAHVYILTITDQANFQQVEHHSVWDTYENAQLKADEVRYALIERDKYHGLGDTFHVDICLMGVHTANDL